MCYATVYRNIQAVKDKKMSDMLLVVMSTLSTAAYLLL